MNDSSYVAKDRKIIVILRINFNHFTILLRADLFRDFVRRLRLTENQFIQQLRTNGNSFPL